MDFSSQGVVFVTVIVLTRGQNTGYRPLSPSNLVYDSYSRESYVKYYNTPQNGPIVTAGQCSSALCLQGTVCRMVRDCSSCTASSRCINPNQIPAYPDIVCRNSEMKQALLTAGKNNNGLYEGVICALFDDENTCPLGTECVHGVGGMGMCCSKSVQQQQQTWTPDTTRTFVPLTSFNSRISNDDIRTGGFNIKSGSCSRLFRSRSGSCSGGIMCTSDDLCPGRQKCCPSGCGFNKCSSPIMLAPPFGCGVCPRGTKCQRVSTNMERCVRIVQSFDDRWNTGQWNRGQPLIGQLNSGIPVNPRWDTRPCPNPARRFCGLGRLVHRCTTDFQCSINQRCCFDGCINRCL